jgi:hypothetical protein
MMKYNCLQCTHFPWPPKELVIICMKLTQVQLGKFLIVTSYWLCVMRWTEGNDVNISIPQWRNFSWWQNNSLQTSSNFPLICRNPSLGLMTKARACKVTSQEGSQGSHTSCSWECKKVWGNEPTHFQRSSHFGSWSPGGFSNFHRIISGVQTQWAKEFLISLEISCNLDVLNGLAWLIWTFETQVMAKRRVGSQIANLTPDH